MVESLHEFMLRLKALFRKRRMEREMADELAFHQDMLHDKYLRQGVAMADVDAETRRRFGSASRSMNSRRIGTSWVSRQLRPALAAGFD